MVNDGRETKVFAAVTTHPEVDYDDDLTF